MPRNTLFKHLMTGPKGKSEFCTTPPRPSMFTKGHIEGQIIIIHVNVQSRDKHCPTSMADWHTNLLWFQGVEPDHVQVESSSCCFPRELVSSVHPREL